jgi:stalled ribosome rescue protein Dom34
MTFQQSIVWIDGKEARVLRVENGLQLVSTIHAPVIADTPNQPARIGEAPGDLSGFFQEVARALDVANEILVVGPSTTKEEFVKYLHKNDHAFDPRILGVETIDHPDDRELAGYAKLYFTSGGPRRRGNGSGYKGTG